MNAMHTSADIRVPLVQRSIPCVGIGSRSGNLAQNGLHDEWVDTEDFVRLVLTTAEVIGSWCGVAAIDEESSSRPASAPASA